VFAGETAWWWKIGNMAFVPTTTVPSPTAVTTLAHLVPKRDSGSPKLFWG
jgi:hypothetical protein